MEQFNARDKQIFEDMKQCIQDFGLKILDEKLEDDIISGLSTFEYDNYNMGIVFSYDTIDNVAQMFIQYENIPAEKILALYELLNHINGYLIFNHFHIDTGTRIIELLSGIKVTGYFLSKEAFKIILLQNLVIGRIVMPLIGKLLSTDENPQTIMDEFFARKNREFLGPDGKVKEPKITEDIPFIIEVSANIPAFPTHTHGLTKLGMPEFLIDHFCMGPVGNGGRINSSYKYFTKAENASKLNAIKNGETVKLTITDLNPDAKPGKLIYCYRRVYPEFEMVKQAYDLDDPNQVSPETWFVQIYVEGDDFALTDDYYKGGIKW